jgi:hypothetical protein
MNFSLISNLFVKIMLHPTISPLPEDDSQTRQNKQGTTNPYQYNSHLSGNDKEDYRQDNGTYNFSIIGLCIYPRSSKPNGSIELQ